MKMYFEFINKTSYLHYTQKLWKKDVFQDVDVKIQIYLYLNFNFNVLKHIFFSMDHHN